MGQVKGDQYIVEMVLRGQQQMAKGLDNVAKSIAKLTTQVNKMGSQTSKDSAKVRSNVSSMSSAVVGATGSFSALVKTGAIMSIGWQIINGILTTTIQLFKDLVMGGVELEAAMVAIKTVTESTGRSYGEVMQIMTKHTDAFMTKTALAPGILRLLGTSLSTKQIDQFIQSVKDGSTAMGFQANEQLPILARGFKQLTANILDNIGVTVNLNRLRRQASKELGIASDLLSENQLHQTLFNEIVQQTSKFQGLYNQQLETAKGAMSSVNAAWVSLTETVGNTKAVQDASAGVAGLITAIENGIIIMREKIKVQQELKKQEEESAKQEQILTDSTDEFAESQAKSSKEIHDWLVEVSKGNDILATFAQNLLLNARGLEIYATQAIEEAKTNIRELGKTTGRTDEQIVKFANNQDAIKATMLDFAKTLSLAGLSEEDFNKIITNNIASLQTLALHTGLSTAELVKLGFEELKSANSSGKFVEAVDAIDFSLQNMNKRIVDMLDAQALTVPSIAAIANDLQNEIDKRDELQQLITSQRQFIDNLTQSIETENRAIRQYRIQLRNVSNELSEWIKKQREAESAVRELQRTLERKLKVLMPELFPPETENLLTDIQNQKKQTLQTKIATEQKLKQATSVKEYNELLAEAMGLQSHLEDLDAQEIELTKQLTAEVAALQSQLAGKNAELATANSHVASLTSQQKQLNDMILTGTDKIGNWNEQLKDARVQVADWEEQLTPLTETNGIIDTLNAKLAESIAKWKEFANLDDISKTITITENKIFSSSGGGGFSGETPFGTIFNNQTFSIRIGQVSAGTPSDRTAFFKGLKEAIGARIGNI